MNVTHHEAAGARPKAVMRARSDSNPPNVLSVDPPARRKSWMNSHDEKWINHYNEEWAAFIEEHSMKRRGSDLCVIEPEALPRVWNLPHG